ncbi:hypothetical protein [Paeniglutamicibacter psychrophenolicus]|uniref:hypothetical protein n=1 Tax=Paeniglutamicibacter psychrophenolicus TaxID=257454 RepID=UPI00278470CB|nr:hypothetical protein [Paeniglutamicibacter psychrophenolicus]MDQ0095565.1 hypothetical protein [Paeniglutamicibacter psychrophenolicus]
MKRHLATALAASFLVAALAGCVPLDHVAPVSPPAADPPVPEAPVFEPMPSTPVPDLKPYSSKGIEERVSGLSKNSPARKILAGTFTHDSAVPGSVRLLYAEKSVGGQQAVIPTGGQETGIGYYVRCAEETRFSLDLSDGNTGRDFSSSGSSCEASGSSGGGSGLPDGVESIYLDFDPAAEVPTEVVVFSYTAVPYDG